jgi:hypothetical protein
LGWVIQYGSISKIGIFFGRKIKPLTVAVYDGLKSVLFPFHRQYSKADKVSLSIPLSVAGVSGATVAYSSDMNSIALGI